jgi:hypothetical protein
VAGITSLSFCDFAPNLVLVVPIAAIGQNRIARLGIARGYVPWYGMESLHGVAGLTIPDEIGVVGIPTRLITMTKGTVNIVALLGHVLQSLRIIRRVRIGVAVLIQRICMGLVTGVATLNRGGSQSSRAVDWILIIIVGH